MKIKINNNEIDTLKPKYNGYNAITCEQYCNFRLLSEAQGLNVDELNKAHVALFYDLTYEQLLSLPATAYFEMYDTVCNYPSAVNELSEIYYQYAGVFYYLYLDIDNMNVGHFADLEHIESQFPNIWERLPRVVSILTYTEDQLNDDDVLQYNGSVAMTRAEVINKFPFSVIISFHNAYIEKKKTLQNTILKSTILINQLEQMAEMLKTIHLQTELI